MYYASFSLSSIALKPSRTAFGVGLVVRGQDDDLRVILASDPGETGLNTFNVYLRGALGRTINEVQKVALIFTMIERDMGVTEAVSERVGEVHFAVHGGLVIPRCRERGRQRCWSVVPGDMLPEQH